MKKEDIISGIEELLTKETTKGFTKEFSQLKKEFNSILREDEKKLKQKELIAHQDEEAEDNEANVEEYDHALNKELDNKINSLIADFEEKQNKERQEQKKEWEQNIVLKRELLESLEQLNVEEERIGPAITQFKKIKEEWNLIGNVAPEKVDDIQNRYSRAIDQFNYNIGIYKQLQSHDLKKNQKTKENLIEEVKSLLDQEKIKEVEKSLKSIQQRWADTGPTSQEAWETLKETYWENVRTVQDKIQEFYDKRKSEFKENLRLKIELIEKVKEIMEREETPSSHREWEAITKEMLQVQEEWNKIGMATPESNEQARTLFRSYYDTFFADKQEFYSGLKAKNEVLKEKKVALIEKAKELETSTDWKQTTEELIQLQKQWKNIGSISRGEEQKLWKTFRTSCDNFFDTKKTHFDKIDEANVGNLKLKQDVIAKIEAFTVSEDLEKSIQELKQFSAEFNTIGHVPFKEKEKIYNDYKKALELHYSQLKLKESEKEKLLFENKLDILKQSVDPSKAFERERINIQNKISSLNDEIVQSENNLGFFSGKGAEKLKEQVAQNVSKIQEQINGLKIRLKLIPRDYSEE